MKNGPKNHFLSKGLALTMMQPGITWIPFMGIHALYQTQKGRTLLSIAHYSMARMHDSATLCTWRKVVTIHLKKPESLKIWITIIKQKMCADDRKVWLRDLEQEGKSASLKGLMEWMSVEMKSHMNATAPLRSSSKNPHKVTIFNLKVAKTRSRPITDAGYTGTPPIGWTSAPNLLLSVI